MNALVLPLLCSLSWLAAFAAGTATGHVYAFLGATALLSAAVLLSRDASLRARLRGRPVDVVVGIAVGVGSLVATYGLYPLVVSFMPGLRVEVVELYGIAAVAPTSPAVFAVVVVAAAEEVIWRGALLAALLPLCARLAPGRLVSTALAIVVAAGVYAVAQAGSGSPWLAVTALAFGVVWGALAVWRGNLVAPLIAHLIWTPMVLSLRPLVELAKN